MDPAETSSHPNTKAEANTYLTYAGVIKDILGHLKIIPLCVALQPCCFISEWLLHWLEGIFFLPLTTSVYMCPWALLKSHTSFPIKKIKSNVLWTKRDLVWGQEGSWRHGPSGPDHVWIAGDRQQVNVTRSDQVDICTAILTNDAHLNVKRTCAPKMSQYEKGGQYSNEPQTPYREAVSPSVIRECFI